MSEEIAAVLDAVEDRLDEIESEFGVESSGTDILVKVVAGVLVAAVSGGVSWYIAKRRYKKQYSDLAEQEIAEAKAFYALREKPGSPEELAVEKGYEIDDSSEPEVEDAPQELKRIVRDYTNPTGSKPDQIITEDSGNITRSVFADGEQSIWDYKAEVAQREENPDIPYIISAAEFMENEFENEQVTITYYEGDNVVGDERDEVLREAEMLLGTDNFRFGHGSNDRNIVYIRNEGVGTDFEVLRSTGKYAQEVLGFTHSDDEDRRRDRRRLRDD